MLGQPNLPNRCRVSCQRQLPLARQQWHWIWQRSLLTQTESGWISLFFVQRCHTAETFSEFSCSTEGKGRGTRKEREREGTTTGETHKSPQATSHTLAQANGHLVVNPCSSNLGSKPGSGLLCGRGTQPKKAIQHFCSNSASCWQFVSKSRRLRCTACLCGQAKYSVEGMQQKR